VRAALTSPVDTGLVRGPDPESAVLVPIFEEGGEARLVLTRRASTLRFHRREVAFPGGRVDPDESLAGAALREAHEEVGLDPTAVELIGTLGSLTTVSSRARITPFVGVMAERPRLTANPDEVERVFDVSLSELVADGVHRSERWGVAPTEIEVQFFHVDGDIVWGATGRVLVDLLRRVLGLGPMAGHLAAGRPSP